MAFIVVTFKLFCLPVEAQSNDWPQFLGPTRNGVYAGKPLSLDWPKGEPRTVWKKKVGQGFSGPVILREKLILFHRVEDREVVECFGVGSGESIWRFEYRTQYRDDFGFDEGPRATPAIADDKVYAFGAEGALHCIDLNSGKKVWGVQVRDEYKARKGFFGAACSPLIEGKRVILNVGGTDGAGIIALNKESGVLEWKSTEDEASYSSPVAADINGKRTVLFFTRNGLVGSDPGNGNVRWRFPWRSRSQASVNAATPLVIGDLIFLSTSYDTGAVLLRANGTLLEKVWSSDDAISNHYSTCVYHNGFLYGFHGRQETGQSFRCVDFKTGTVKWSHDRIPAGTVTLAGNVLVLLLEDGRVLGVPASSERFQMLAQGQVLPFGVRSYPAFANGRLYVRSKDTLVCVQMGPEPK
jgi:outer membrane protein assembly factor BamB